MAKKNPAARPPTVNHSTPPLHPGLAAYCKDLEDWPRRWMFDDRDLAPGQKLVACFRPFMEHLIALDLSRKTIRKHIDNLWILGGEIIRDLNETPSLRKRPITDLVFEGVEDGGLLPYHHDSEEEIRSFESTCRRYRRFLEQQRG